MAEMSIPLIPPCAMWLLCPVKLEAEMKCRGFRGVHTHTHTHLLVSQRVCLPAMLWID